jgi:hypothetical protein
VEVLYHVDVIAIARWGTTRVRLAPGEDGTTTVAVPGIIGIDERRLRPVVAAFVVSRILKSLNRRWAGVRRTLDNSTARYP